MNPGTHKGKIVGCDAGVVGQNKTPVVKIFFEVEGKKIPWTGWFSEKTNEKTGKTYSELVIEKLVELGFSGKCISEMSDPNKSAQQLFDCDFEWDLEIDFQTDKNGEKTKYMEVRWINNPNKGFKFNHQDSVEAFAGMKGLLAQAKQTVIKPKKQDKPASDDIPF